MTARLIHLHTFGTLAPATARRRLWVPPGRALPVSRADYLTVYVDQVDDHDEVVFTLRGPAAGPLGSRSAVLGMYCEALNFRICARATERVGRGVERVLVELVNLQRAARAS